MNGECKNCHRPSKGTFNGEEYCGIHLRSEKNAQQWRQDYENKRALERVLRERMHLIGLDAEELFVYEPDWHKGLRANLSIEVFDRLLDIAEEAAQ